MSTREIADDLIDETASSYERQERGIFVTARRETLANAISDALTKAIADERERAATIKFAQVLPVGAGCTVSIGALGIKLFGLDTDATICAEAINRAIAAAIRRDSTGEEGR